ncbi:MAG: thiosulfate oxidation carrier protein SoxY [Gammaproteobacteria bacterium]|nr:thiosulfate oxidation carrier protein SoxY [Gammaproteobacteria bacterium]
MIIKRRIVLKGVLAAFAAGSALLASAGAYSAWPKAAFSSKTQTDILQSLYGDIEAVPSGKIKIKTPDVAENGASVPVNISTEIADVESISIVVPNNPLPLAGLFEHGGGILGYVSTRIKMGKTGDVIAVVKSNGRLYTAKKTVKVTLGGCGG